MTERWVVNASPLISLARIGCADWFLELADEVVVPAAVKTEIEAGPADAAQRYLAAGRLPVVTAPAPGGALRSWDLGAGETSVLAIVEADPERCAVLDDLAARRCAQTLGLSVIGTLGIVVLARQAGLTTSAAEVLAELRSGGFRLDDAVLRRVLREAVDEDWPG